MADISPAILQAQAAAQAPGQSIGAQSTPVVAPTRKQSKGSKTNSKAKAPNVAASLYPNLPTTQS
jgi:hypothetical protein